MPCFRRLRHVVLATALVAIPSVASSVHAKTDLYLHSSVRTEPQNVVVTEALNRGALNAIQTRINGQRALKKVTFAKDDADATVIWTKGDKTVDKFAVAGPSTLQCIGALLKKRLKPASEQRIACRFFDPQSFIIVIYDSDGTLHLRETKLQNTNPKVGPQPSAIQKKYGVEGFYNQDAKWTAAEFAIVDEALALLSKRELAIVSDVPFVRAHKSKKKRSAAPGSVAGLYLPGEGKLGSKIFIYDAFTTNDGIILGTVAKQYGPGTMALIHEFGHALASAAFRKKQNTVNDAINEKVALKKKRDDAKAAYKAAEAKYNSKKNDRSMSQAAKNKLIDDLNAKIHAFNALDNRYRKIITDENKLIKKQSRTGKPAEAALAKLLPQRGAVTLYGRTTAGEAFAEAYMLFKLDPGALKRISPKAHAYFESEQYLDVIEADINKRLSK